MWDYGSQFTNLFYVDFDRVPVFIHFALNFNGNFAGLRSGFTQRLWSISTLIVPVALNTYRSSKCARRYTPRSVTHASSRSDLALSSSCCCRSGRQTAVFAGKFISRRRAGETAPLSRQNRVEHSAITANDCSHNFFMITSSLHVVSDPFNKVILNNLRQKESFFCTRLRATG